MSEFDLPRRLVAEMLGTALLVATVVGSGVMSSMVVACAELKVWVSSMARSTSS